MTVTDSPTTTRPAARWAVVAAYAAPLCVAPSSLWRLSILGDETVRLDAEGWYLITLSLLSMGLALLTLGLVHRWGERIPRRVPGLGGRPVPARAAVAPAATGALLLIAICAYVLLNAVFGFVERGPVLIGPDGADAVRRPEPGIEVLAFYLPLLLWGPLVLAVAVDRWRRRAR